MITDLKIADEIFLICDKCFQRCLYDPADRAEADKFYSVHKAHGADCYYQVRELFNIPHPNSLMYYKPGE